LAGELTPALRLGGVPRLGGAVLRRRPNLLLALLVVPLLLFVAIVFLWPVLRFLWLSVDNTDISSNLGRTTAALAAWDPAEGAPGEAAFAALVADLAEARANGRDGVLAQLINQRL